MLSLNAPIAVTGASGWLGSEVSCWLERHGQVVRRISRSGVGNRVMDLRHDEVDTIGQAIAGCQCVVHCAAHVHQPIETELDRPLFIDINVRGTERLVSACIAQGVTRFVFVSSIAVYDWAANLPPRVEGAPLAPTTAYALSKLAGEKIVQASPLDWRIARVATVFGPGDRANFRRLAIAMRQRRFIVPGTGTARKSVVPVSHAAEVLGRLALREDLYGVLLNVAAPTPPSLAQICEAFQAICGFAPPYHIPIPLLRAAGWVGDAVGRFRLPAPITNSILDKLVSDTVVDVNCLMTAMPEVTWESFSVSLQRYASYYTRVT